MEPPPGQARISRVGQFFWLFSIITIAYMIWVRYYLAPLTSAEIVRFEIAKTVGNARNIIQEWKQAGKYDLGVKSTYFAFGFMILYTVAIALGCRFISACTRNDILTKGGRAFAWLIGLATICDFFENISLGRTLHGNISQLNVTVAYNLARIKFSIVIVCLLFMVTCFLYWVIISLDKEKK